MKNKVLIIDDDFDFVEAVKTLLEANGYEVSLAYDGHDGFQKIKNESPELIILDMMMTYKTEGVDIAKTISQDAATKDIPVLLITGAKKDMNFPFDLEPDENNLPVKAVLEKPIQPEVLLKMVTTYIKQTGDKHRVLVEELKSLVDKWSGKKGKLIMILHEIQNHYGYVPRAISFELSRLLDIPLARIYEVITFYNFFKLIPPGKHLISLCMGTACYLKGAQAILNELKKILKIEEGETTKDGLFHLQVVRCLGCCGLAPVIMIDNKVFARVSKDTVVDIVSGYRERLDEK
ncbi:MAG: NAD(P)H-dependent oxidoreductase subunit E [Candidatus Gygaella obscura]|nr:NAD(P)H-dependent oxidoreductase subunit E [Candidatus Gygaella obscura]